MSLQSYMCRNIYNILEKLDLNIHVLFSHNASRIKTMLKQRVVSRDWRPTMIKELLECREGSMQCGMSAQEIDTLLIHLCTA